LTQRSLVPDGGRMRWRHFIAVRLAPELLQLVIVADGVTNC
jgi:hypothetical protein